jgi:hypothetical protein
MGYQLLNVNGNAKTIKGNKRGYLTGILYLAPATEAGIKDSKGKVVSLCPFSSKGCREACLYDSGRARVFPVVKKARIRKTKELFYQTELFMRKLYTDILILEAEAKGNDLTPVVRLNGTSDLDWREFKLNGKTLFEHFPHIQFYDYTKRADLFKGKPKNLHLTFSYSGTNVSLVNKIAADTNLAVVVSKDVKKILLEDSKTFIDGDLDDLRFNDDKGKVILLKAKGYAIYDETGFLVA